LKPRLKETKVVLIIQHLKYATKLINKGGNLMRTSKLILILYGGYTNWGEKTAGFLK
jgi:hypothetical protein